MLSPSRQPKDRASPSSARKTSWAPANSETKATSICRFSLTKESKLSIVSGGWCKLPIDGICSLIVLLLTCFSGEAEQERWRLPSRYQRADHIPCQRSVHITDGASSLLFEHTLQSGMPSSPAPALASAGDTDR